MAIRQRTSAAKDVIVLTSLVPLPTWLTREDGWVQHVWQSHGLSATSPSCFDPPDSHGHGMAYTSCWSCLYYELWGTCHHSKSKKTKHKALAGVDCEWLTPQHKTAFESLNLKAQRFFQQDIPGLLHFQTSESSYPNQNFWVNMVNMQFGQHRQPVTCNRFMGSPPPRSWEVGGKVTEATEAVSHAPKRPGRQSANAMKPVAGQKAAASALAETASPHVLEHT